MGTLRVPANCSCLEILEGEGFPCLAWHSLRFLHTIEGQKFYGLCPQMGKYRSRPYSHLSQHRQRLCCVSGAGSQRDCSDTRPGQCVYACVCVWVHSHMTQVRAVAGGVRFPGSWEPQDLDVGNRTCVCRKSNIHCLLTSEPSFQPPGSAVSAQGSPFGHQEVRDRDLG